MSKNNKNIYANTFKVLAVAVGVSLSLNLIQQSALAATLDRPFFRASAIVIVFGGSDFIENGGTGPVASDFYLLDNIPSGQAGADIIGADGVTLEYFGSANTPISDGTARTNELLRIEGQPSGGALTNVADFNILDANDSLTEFGIDDNTDLDMSTFYRFSRFYVTSNAAFDMYAQATNLTATQDFTALGYSDFRYILFSQTTGSAAQNPAIGGLGRINAINDLGDISAGPTKIFDGGRRTARTRGTIQQQAVSFIPVYYIFNGDPGNAYDLSMGTGTIGATVTYTIYTP
ncbi:MAG: hypothetical protein L3J65_12835 [Robiginitomaculum sp.]|nr:hypothetical protein [Robiginitomaculum sp.]